MFTPDEELQKIDRNELIRLFHINRIKYIKMKTELDNTPASNDLAINRQLMVSPNSNVLTTLNTIRSYIVQNLGTTLERDLDTIFTLLQNQTRQTDDTLEAVVKSQSNRISTNDNLKLSIDNLISSIRVPPNSNGIVIDIGNKVSEIIGINSFPSGITNVTITNITFDPSSSSVKITIGGDQYSINFSSGINKDSTFDLTFASASASDIKTITFINKSGGQLDSSNALLKYMTYNYPLNQKIDSQLLNNVDIIKKIVTGSINTTFPFFGLYRIKSLLSQTENNINSAVTSIRDKVFTDSNLSLYLDDELQAIKNKVGNIGGADTNIKDGIDEIQLRLGGTGTILDRIGTIGAASGGLATLIGNSSNNTVVKLNYDLSGINNVKDALDAFLNLFQSDSSKSIKIDLTSTAPSSLSDLISKFTNTSSG